MAATARISNNRRAAAQQLQLSAKSGITGGTSTDSASSDQVLLHNLHTVRGISYCRFREHALMAIAPLSQTAGGAYRGHYTYRLELTVAWLGIVRDGYSHSYRHDLFKYFRHTKTSCIPLPNK